MTRASAAIAVSIAALWRARSRRPPWPVTAPRQGQHALRAAVTDEDFYFVMADRFENGDPANDLGGLPADRDATGFDPTSKGYYNGGDLKGLLGEDRLHPRPRHGLDLAHPQLQEQGRSSPRTAAPATTATGSPTSRRSTRTSAPTRTCAR